MAVVVGENVKGVKLLHTGNNGNKVGKGIGRFNGKGEAFSDILPKSRRQKVRRRQRIGAVRRVQVMIIRKGKRSLWSINLFFEPVTLTTSPISVTEATIISFPPKISSCKYELFLKENIGIYVKSGAKQISENVKKLRRGRFETSGSRSRCRQWRCRNEVLSSKKPFHWKWCICHILHLGAKAFYKF